VALRAERAARWAHTTLRWSACQMFPGPPHPSFLRQTPSHAHTRLATDRGSSVRVPQRPIFLKGDLVHGRLILLRRHLSSTALMAPSCHKLVIACVAARCDPEAFSFHLWGTLCSHLFSAVGCLTLRCQSPTTLVDYHDCAGDAIGGQGSQHHWYCNKRCREQAPRSHRVKPELIRESEVCVRKMLTSGHKRRGASAVVAAAWMGKRLAVP